MFVLFYDTLHVGRHSRNSQGHNVMHNPSYGAKLTE